jgi:choline-sulfatase
MPEYPAPGRLHFPNATLPELLQLNGYTTAAIGKWHIYTWPDKIGFDHYVIPRTHHVHSAQHYTEDGGPEFVPDGWSVEFETQRACDYLRKDHGDQPFFLYLNYSPPHPPLRDCPEKYLQRYDPASLTLRKNVDESGAGLNDHARRVYRWDYRYYELQLPYTLAPMDDSIRDLYAEYYGNVTWLDDNLGRVLQALDDSGQRNDTLVVFTADHGDNLGSHGRNGKGLPYDESLRVPMIYSQPGRLAPRVDQDNQAGLVDVAATLLTHAGIDVPADMHGADALNTGIPVAISEIIPGNMVARTRRFTSHVNMRQELCQVAFFDNVEDPFQMNNLAGTDAFPAEQRELCDILKTHHAEIPILPKPDYGFTE